MTVLDAAQQVLREAKEPLHYEEITRQLLDRRLWTPRTKTPSRTVGAAIYTDIQKRGTASPFRSAGKGVFVLSCSVSEQIRRTETEAPSGKARRFGGMPSTNRRCAPPASTHVALAFTLSTWRTVKGGEVTNNSAERRSRPAVVWRKSSVAHQSDTGDQFVGPGARLADPRP